MIYLDTSVLVSALTPEALTKNVQAWLARNQEEDFLVSHWVIAEVHSALALKVRTGRLSLADRKPVLREFELMRKQLSICDVDREHFSTAAEILDQHKLGLRAGDALHLAIAADQDATLATLDVTLFEAARTCGADAVRPA